MMMVGIAPRMGVDNGYSIYNMRMEKQRYIENIGYEENREN